MYWGPILAAAVVCALPAPAQAMPAFDPYDGYVLVSYDSENGSVSVLEPGLRAPNRIR